MHQKTAQSRWLKNLTPKKEKDDTSKGKLESWMYYWRPWIITSKMRSKSQFTNNTQWPVLSSYEVIYWKWVHGRRTRLTIQTITTPIRPMVHHGNCGNWETSHSSLTDQESSKINAASHCTKTTPRKTKKENKQSLPSFLILDYRPGNDGVYSAHHQVQ